jgi:hypothetical protein
MAYSKPISLGDYQGNALSNFDAGDDGCVAVGPDNLGLGAQLGPFFEAVVNALVQHPIPRLPIAVGENGATAAASTLFWAYDPAGGFTLEAKPGYLTTAAGDGGFSLHVAANGNWSLTFDGSGKTIGHYAGEKPTTPPPPPAGNALVDNGAASPIPSDGPNAFSYNGSAGHITFDGLTDNGTPVSDLDTVSGGVGDYIIGGSAPHTVPAGGGLALGNCAIYTDSSTPVLVDGQNGTGYGGTAEGNVLVNINQIRGSLNSNVLIGNTDGTDLKSGGNDSILISTGGYGYELRPDGYGNVLVSTVGADRVVFDPTHGWALGDLNTMLGFDPAHGDYLDFSLIPNNFAAGDNINNYVKLVNDPSGEAVMFNATGNVATAGVEVLDLDLVHGLTAQGLFNSHNLVI